MTQPNEEFIEVTSAEVGERTIAPTDRALGIDPNSPAEEAVAGDPWLDVVRRVQEQPRSIATELQIQEQAAGFVIDAANFLTALRSDHAAIALADIIDSEIADWAEADNDGDPIPASKLANQRFTVALQQRLAALNFRSLTSIAVSGTTFTLTWVDGDGNTQTKSAELPAGGGTGGLSQAQVLALFSSWAQATNTDRIPKSKMPSDAVYTADIPAAQNAADVRVDAGSFDGNLSSADVNVQHALATIDGIDIPAGAASIDVGREQIGSMWTGQSSGGAYTATGITIPASGALVIKLHYAGASIADGEFAITAEDLRGLTAIAVGANLNQNENRSYSYLVSLNQGGVWLGFARDTNNQLLYASQGSEQVQLSLYKLVVTGVLSGGGPTSGLTQAQVDARVATLVSNAALIANATTRWAKTKLPSDTLYTGGVISTALAGNTDRWAKAKVPADTVFGTALSATISGQVLTITLGTLTDTVTLPAPAASADVSQLEPETLPSAGTTDTGVIANQQGILWVNDATSSAHVFEFTVGSGTVYTVASRGYNALAGSTAFGGTQDANGPARVVWPASDSAFYDTNRTLIALLPKTRLGQTQPTASSYVKMTGGGYADLILQPHATRNTSDYWGFASAPGDPRLDGDATLADGTHFRMEFYSDQGFTEPQTIVEPDRWTRLLTPQVQSDWDATSGAAAIKNKPSIPGPVGNDDITPAFLDADTAAKKLAFRQRIGALEADPPSLAAPPSMPTNGTSFTPSQIITVRQYGQMVAGSGDASGLSFVGYFRGAPDIGSLDPEADSLDALVSYGSSGGLATLREKHVLWRRHGITLTPDQLEFSTDGGRSFTTAAISTTPLGVSPNAFEVRLPGNFAFVSGSRYQINVRYTDGSRAYADVMLQTGRPVIYESGNWIPKVSVLEDLQVHIRPQAFTDDDSRWPFNKSPMIQLGQSAYDALVAAGTVDNDILYLVAGA